MSNVLSVKDIVYLCSRSQFLRKSALYIPLRCKSRVKKKWASEPIKRLYTDIALQHFDMFYKPVYGKLWPSLRVSLLTTSKYCALLNNYHTEQQRVEEKLISLGSQNGMTVVTDALKRRQFDDSLCENDTEKYFIKEEVDSARIPSRASERMIDDDDEEEEEEDAVQRAEIEPIREKNTTLYDFIPAEEVYTEKEKLRKEEFESSVYRGNSSDIPINFVQEDNRILPENLKFFIFEKGNTSNFPAPKMKYGNQLGYYMMDAASLLPVIVLGINEKDKVLDLCAAPGGKTLAMLQTHLIGELVCNDLSASRLKRLQNTLEWYLGDRNPNFIKIIKGDGVHFQDSGFDKVLVDVPCNTDRHVVAVEDNNLFKPGRLNERLSLMTTQRNLLVSGIKACSPGGSVVYSTCTLSPAQNDGVVQAACEYMWKETDIDIAIVDLDFIPDICGDIFKFYKGCRYGQLVIPALSCNFGPMYFCKIKRLN